WLPKAARGRRPGERAPLLSRDWHASDRSATKSHPWTPVPSTARRRARPREHESARPLRQSCTSRPGNRGENWKSPRAERWRSESLTSSHVRPMTPVECRKRVSERGLAEKRKRHRARNKMFVQAVAFRCILIG